MPSEVHMARSSRLSSWGFRLTGGVTFSMPLTVFEVQEGGFADRVGIRVGDVLLKINGRPTDRLTLKEANTTIDKLEEMDLEVTNLQDKEATELEEKMMGEYEEEEQQINHLDINSMELLPPRPAPKPETAQRKCWHPVVLDSNPTPIIEESTGDEEAPHKKILRNFRQAMTHKQLDASPEGPPRRKPPPPPPQGDDDDDISQSSAELTVEDQLRMMQRQIANLCELPAVLQRSLAAVNEKICKLLPPEPEPDQETTEEPEDPSTEDYLEEEQSYDYSRDESEQIHEEEEEESEQVHEEEESVQESEQEPELSPEEIERLEKIKKMEQLNKVWMDQLNREAKPVYKLSDRYKVPHSEVFSNRIQSIESKMVMRKPPEHID